jgi:cyanobactin maturation PatA/PatG family protease
MPVVPLLPGIEALWAKTTGDPRVRVAILDGPVDLSHCCFEGVKLDERLGHLRDKNDQAAGPMAVHGTHTASVIFGRHGGPVAGIAPGCTGMSIPVFSERRRRLSQLDLSRAIEAAVQLGAHVINISGGQLTNAGEAENWLDHAIRHCADKNVLVVAAAGNDGCQCLHVPAALPAVLAVGAMDERGRPVDFSNWGDAYKTQGVLAPGTQILGAMPGGGTVRRTGTSMATPIVTGVAALLLSEQVRRGREPDPRAVRAAILHGSDACDSRQVGDCSRFLVGALNVLGAEQALNAIERNELPMLEQTSVLEPSTMEAAGGVATSCRCEQSPVPEGDARVDSATISDATHAPAAEKRMPAPRKEPPKTAPVVASAASSSMMSSSMTASVAAAAIQPSQTSSELTYAFQPGGGLVYALGVLGFDFGTEARRDSFKQLMGHAFPPGYRTPSGPIPHDARDMVSYLKYAGVDDHGRPVLDPSKPTYYHLDEAKSLIWTLNLELTPIYGLEPLGPFSYQVYKLLVDLLDAQTQPTQTVDPQTKVAKKNDDYVERVSIPGMLAGRTVRLFSGQTLPIVELENTRGIYGWHVNDLVKAALAKIREVLGRELTDSEQVQVDQSLTNFLNRIYYDFRNLGVTPPDRALNFAVTNVVQSALAFADAIAEGKELDAIEVLKSPTCRLDSDCWDIKLKFFDPMQLTKAVKVVRLTIDISDKMPVTLGTLRTWAQRY